MNNIPEQIPEPIQAIERASISHRCRIGLLIGASFAITAFVPTTSYAQDAAGAAADTSAEAQDIIVTAQRRSESLMRVPVAMSAFTSDKLAASGVSGIQSLQILTPALVYPNTGPYAQPYIRGIGSRILQNGLDPSVATYVDGRYISRQTAVMLDFADIERVEVLKGPQGVLFGRNASAGAIRVITKDVAPDLEGYVRAGYGNYNQWGLSGAVNLPASDTLGVRLSALTSQRDGYAKNLSTVGRRRLDDKDLIAVRGKVRWQPTSTLDVRLSLSHWRQDDNSGNDIVVLPPLTLNSAIVAGGVTGTDRKHVGTAMTTTNNKKETAGEFDVKLDMDWATLQTITTYSDLNNKLTFDADGTSARALDGRAREKSKTFSHEVQLASESSGSVEWIVGGYFFRDNTKFNTFIDIGPRVISQGQQNVVTRSLAAFGQAKWKFADHFSLTLGGRYSKDRKTLHLLPSTIPGTVTVSVTPYADHDSWSKFTPAVILDYTLDNTMLYLKFARGFKSGGFNYPAAATTPVLQPEVLDMYEGGLKGDFFDRKVRLILAGYYYKYRDLQVTRAAGSGVGAVVVTQNAANAKLYGLDADLTWFATRSLSFTGGLAWQHSEYQDYLASAKQFRATIPGLTGPGMVDVGFDAGGEKLLRAPSLSASISADYSVPLSSGNVPINISYAYRSSYDFDFIYDAPGTILSGQTKALRQKAYSLVNARIGYTPDSAKWSISAWMNNVTNEKYFDDVVAAGPGIRGSYGAPRTYGMEVELTF
ncbi:MAG: TonB-dependent receptor [Sphingomonadaceae bacterium]